MLDDLLLSLALMALLVLFLHVLGGREVPAASARLELDWPRGVQEEEPIHFRTELARTRGVVRRGIR